jgi:ABC-type polysaccharide/polyol phosphate export permease
VTPGGAWPPLASFGQLLRYRTLVKNLVLKDLKLKYRSSVLGVAWSLLNPLLTLLVYTFAFHTVLRVQMPGYAAFLMVSLLPWNFFSGSLNGSTSSVVANAHLIRKVYFPRETLPVATVLFGFAQLLLALVVLLPATLALSGLAPRWTIVLSLPLLALHVTFTIGLALALSALSAFFRDIMHLTEVLLLLLFWLTPVVYPVSMAPLRLQPFLKVNPLAAFAIAYQDLLFWGRVPEPLVLAAVVVSPPLALLAGLLIFRRLSPGLAERV